MQTKLKVMKAKTQIKVSFQFETQEMATLYRMCYILANNPSNINELNSVNFRVFADNFLAAYKKLPVGIQTKVEAAHE